MLILIYLIAIFFGKKLNCHLCTLNIKQIQSTTFLFNSTFSIKYMKYKGLTWDNLVASSLTSAKILCAIFAKINSHGTKFKIFKFYEQFYFIHNNKQIFLRHNMSLLFISVF